MRPINTWAFRQADIAPTGIQNVAWIIQAPWAHPVWYQYALFLYDLTTPTPGHPPVKLHLPDATHEMLLYALEPDRPIAKDEHLVPGGIHMLTPANYGYQFRADSDEDAEARMQELVNGIVAGKLSPDTDFRSLWDKLLPDMYPLVRSGWA